MGTAVISFTERGMELSRRIKQKLEKEAFGQVVLYTKCSDYPDGEGDVCFVEEPLKEWTGKQFSESGALIFVGACGIAVRSIAPHLQDKLKDIPVLVADEGGDFVIPILSGHYGGGNELAVFVAEQIGAVPVITTATDVNGLFAVDVFARKNGLVVGDKDGIAKVSGKILKERHITFWIDGEVRGTVPPEVELLSKENALWKKSGLSEESVLSEKNSLPKENALCERSNLPEKRFADVAISVKNEGAGLLQLYPKAVLLGMGCKKGKTCGEIEAFVREQLERLHIPMAAVRALATIDRKGKEPGFLEFSEKYGLSFLTYSKEILEAAEGNFSASSFVKNQVGVDNVCERAAAAAVAANAEKMTAENRETGEKKETEKQTAEGKTEDNVRFLLKKTAKDGMTLAVAEEKWSVAFYET
ncbi:MAG: cobalamin biosynthesis protein [Roseburia sp.]|nr:cobalamin biosynthesis protein [Roseburia sp.]